MGQLGPDGSGCVGFNWQACAPVLSWDVGSRRDVIVSHSSGQECRRAAASPGLGWGGGLWWPLLSLGNNSCLLPALSLPGPVLHTGSAVYPEIFISAL